jgi:DNA-binding NarL/FixJ family response regulator
LAQHPGVAIVGEAADGAEVFPLIGPLRPGVVLMDRTLPRRTGIDATRQLKTMGVDVAVIVLTVHADPVYHQAARAAGAAAILEKKTLGMALWPTLLRVRGHGDATDPADASSCS